jgi:hypothetical protein
MASPSLLTFGEIPHMMKIPDPSRGLVRCWGLAAAAILVLSVAHGQRAEALSLINPGPAPAAKYASDGLTTEVRGGHGGHGGGGGGFRGRGGGFRSGGAVFRGGGFRTGHAFRGGGGYRYAAPGIARHHFAPGRAHWHRRHHFRPRYYGYGPSYYYPRRHCRIVWTHYGPRKICRYRPWHHHRR